MTDVSAPSAVGILGTGRMAGILARAIARYAPEASLHLAGRDRAAGERLRGEVPSLAVGSLEAVAGRADLLILAVSPAAYGAVLAQVRGSLRPGAVVVSLSNGVPLEMLGMAVANPIVKVIPTLAQAVGRGVALVVAGPRAGAAELARVTDLFGRFGRAVVVDDRDNRTASNVAGSFLALAAALTEMFIAQNATRAATLDRPTLEAFAAETLGAVSDLVAAGYPLAEIVARTATPGGTTEAALDILRAGFPALAARSVEATFARQAEMLRGAPDLSGA